MDILKKHYEKLILLLLLLIFIGLMFHVLRIVEQTSEIQESHLQIPTREPDHKMANPNDAAFDIAKILQNTSFKWENPGPRPESDSGVAADLTASHPESDGGVATDLAYVFKIVKCPFCGKLIPRECMEDELVCPFCGNAGEGKGEKFAKPPEDVTRPIIPDEIKQRYNLADDPESDLYDYDGDGFSNIYEYMNDKSGDSIGNPHRHPPLWHRLRVIEVGRIKLPVELISVDTMNSDDPKQWEIRIKTNRMTSSYLIDDPLDLDGRTFQIEGVERESGAAPDKKDAFTVVLKEMSGSMTLRWKGEELRSFDDKAVLQDVVSKRQHTVAVGDPVSVGDRRSGSTSYQIKAFDLKGGAVLLESSSKPENPTLDETGAEMRITGAGRIPPSLMVKPRAARDGMTPGGPPPYGNPSPANPAGRRPQR